MHNHRPSFCCAAFTSNTSPTSLVSMTVTQDEGGNLHPHQYVEAMRKKKSIKRSRYTTSTQRRTSSKKAQEKKEALKKDLVNELERQKRVAFTLAMKHNLKQDYVEERMKSASLYSKERKVNTWNAYTYFTSNSLDESKDKQIYN